jgi:hypothetical protein
MKLINLYIYIALACVAFSSCRKQDHFYKDFIKSGEINYVGMVDTAFVHSGNHRIMLSFDLKDPNIDRVKILWDFGEDSLIMPIQKGIGIETFEAMLDNLDERLYSFVIYTLDKENNQSVAYRIQGQSYGDEYIATLLNRAISTVTFVDDNATVNWYEGNEQLYETEVTYTKLDQTTVNMAFPGSTDSIVLTDVDRSKEIKYRTVYKPNELAIDKFYTSYSTRQL